MKNNRAPKNQNTKTKHLTYLLYNYQWLELQIASVSLHLHLIFVTRGSINTLLRLLVAVFYRLISSPKSLVSQYLKRRSKNSPVSIRVVNYESFPQNEQEQFTINPILVQIYVGDRELSHGRKQLQLLTTLTIRLSLSTIEESPS